MLITGKNLKNYYYNIVPHALVHILLKSICMKICTHSLFSIKKRDRKVSFFPFSALKATLETV